MKTNWATLLRAFAEKVAGLIFLVKLTSAVIRKNARDDFLLATSAAAGLYLVFKVTDPD